MSGGEPRGQRPADVEIGASARVREVRFRRRPEVDVRFETGPDGAAESSSERRNLPDRVEPGVTYRDVRVRWHGSAWIFGAGDRDA